MHSVLQSVYAIIYVQQAKCHFAVVIVVFDVTEKETLQHAEQWMEDACGASGSQRPLRFLVGNKTDLVPDSKLEMIKSEAAIVAKRLEAEFWHASARTGNGYNDM